MSSTCESPCRFLPGRQKVDAHTDNIDPNVESQKCYYTAQFTTTHTPTNKHHSKTTATTTHRR